MNSNKTEFHGQKVFMSNKNSTAVHKHSASEELPIRLGSVSYTHLTLPTKA